MSCFRFGGDFELDLRAYQLRDRRLPIKMKPITMELLLLLIEHRGELVTREQIVERIWGKGVFLDTDNSINGAISRIRQVLRDNSEQPRFVQTVTGKGYRFIAPVEEIILAAKPATAADGAPSSESLPESEASSSIGGRSSSWRWSFLLAISVLLIAATSVYFLRWNSPAATQPSSRVMLAVLPFENLTGDASQDYFSDGMTEETITQLGSLNPAHLGVIARTSVSVYKHNPKPLDQVGRELGVQYVLEGSVRRDSENVRVTAQLIQVKDQTHVWAKQYDRKLSDLLALQSEIALEIADEIQLRLGDHDKPNVKRLAARSAPPSSEAYDLYLKGLYFWNKREGSLPIAVDYFQQAIAKDPNYAPAYAGLANAYGLMSTGFQGVPNELMPKARAAAMEGLRRDEGLPQAHAALALVAENYDYDWRTAENEFRRAIELDPNYATAHQWYGEYLSWMGRFEEAFSESEQARKLDPLSLIVASDRGAVLYRARRYDDAIAQFRSVLERDQDFGHPYSYLVMCYVRTGRFTDALDVIKRHMGRLNEAWSQAEVATVYGFMGQNAEAEKALAQFEGEKAASGPLYRTMRLGIYIATGRKDQAIALLQGLFAEHSNVVTSLKTDSLYDPLRDDPRFQDLLRRAGLAGQ
ncbi:MAG TPA: winged helix-turn-helix domain-containing protein [Terriglobales bacterium]|nr:winged helix-turn-helix domain-containing protein [Terriglobales bacterium]